VREQVRVHEIQCEAVEPVGTRQKQLLLAQVHRRRMADPVLRGVLAEECPPVVRLAVVPPALHLAPQALQLTIPRNVYPRGVRRSCAIRADGRQQTVLTWVPLLVRGGHPYI
jgi:hypothetical protein